MKRMYVVLAILVLLLLGVLATCMAQFSGPTPDQIRKRMELREEMHRRMIEKLLHGNGPDQDIFKDMEQMFEDTMNDSFMGFDASSSMSSSTFSTEWKENVRGRSLIITPRDSKQQLDIDVKGGMVTIKGKAEDKSQNSNFISNFSNSFSIPDDCDPDKVKMSQKDGKIVMDFPYRETKKIVVPKKEERKPLPPSEDAVEI